MRFLITLLVLSCGGCATLKADFAAAAKADAPVLVQCADAAGLALASDLLPAVTAALNSGSASLPAQLAALESIGKGGLLCSVEAVAAGAEAQITGSAPAIAPLPLARVRAVHYLAARAK